MFTSLTEKQIKITIVSKFSENFKKILFVWRIEITEKLNYSNLLINCIISPACFSIISGPLNVSAAKLL